MLSAAIRGGSGRSGGRGTGRGGRGGRGGRQGASGARGRRTVVPRPSVPYVASGHIKSGLPSAIDKMIPDAMKACTTGWKEKSLEETKFVVFSEEQYKDKYHRDGLISSYTHAADSIARHLQSVSLDVNAANTLNYLVSNPVFENISQYTTQQLVSRNLDPMNSLETRRFFATKLLRSRFNLSTKKSWTDIMVPLAEKHNLTLMQYERFNNILTSIRGYDVLSRSGDNGDDSWMRRKNLLRNLNPLEKSMFDRSITLLMDPKLGSAVLDDELIASRGQDVECKAYSDRKTGKDGPVADCLADSMICMLFGAST